MSVFDQARLLQSSSDDGDGWSARAEHHGQAADGAQAYRRAWDFHPDIVVTDLTLRGGEGWQLTQDLKREPRTRGIPVMGVPQRRL
jgi:CheY-like chemotaxis protein